MRIDRGSGGKFTGSAGNQSSQYLKLIEGFVTVREAESASAVASGPRCAATRENEVVCTFMVQSALGINDFCPMMARSFDGGASWEEQGPLWPHLRRRYSIFGSVSVSQSGDLFFYGTRTPIDEPGESFWCEALQGMKPNELIWARSSDTGRTWSDPVPISMPIPGAAEAPGAMCIARDGTWHACYCPYNTFDSSLAVPRNQVVLLSRPPHDETWRHTAMMFFTDQLSTAAEAWVVELADGRLLGTCWNLDQRDGSDYPNAYALSRDGGRTWCATRSTGILGQACALTALSDGSALFVYNQRRHGRIGVWLARVWPTTEDFGIESNDIVWEAPHRPSDSDHAGWPKFTFGEPAVTRLPDGTILVVLWCVQGSVGSVRYVKIRLCDSIDGSTHADANKLRRPLGRTAGCLDR